MHRQRIGDEGRSCKRCRTGMKPDGSFGGLFVAGGYLRGEGSGEDVPVPAVESQEEDCASTRTSPRGVAITVSAPLWMTVAPDSEAAASVRSILLALAFEHPVELARMRGEPGRGGGAGARRRPDLPSRVRRRHRGSGGDFARALP
jgi:hypothetical protein